MLQYFGKVTDIAILRLQIEDGRELAEMGVYPSLKLLPPSVGDAISIVGSPESYLTLDEGNIRGVHMFPRLSSGVVREIHEMSRYNLKFPCFHVTVRIRGRMSGSPVLNNSGQICGVAIYSMEQDESEGLEPISYGATLWPCVGIVCSGEPPLKNDVATFYDVILRGEIIEIDIAKVRVGRFEGQLIVTNLELRLQGGL